MKHIYKLILAAFLLFISGCTQSDKKDDPSTKQETSEKTTLSIKITDTVNDKELFHDDVSVEGKADTLADFLEKADVLQVEMEDSQYGKTIMGMMGVVTEDFNKGPWWMYESDTNQECKEAGQCPASSQLHIENGDAFTFTYMTY